MSIGQQQVRLKRRAGALTFAFCAFIIVLCLPRTTQAQWATNGNNINNTNAGNVGVGTSAPNAKVHVVGANGAADNTGATAPSAMTVVGGTGGNGSWGANPGGVGGSIDFFGGAGGTPVAGSNSAFGGLGGPINIMGGVGGTTPYSISSGAGGSVFINGGAPGASSPAGANGNVVLANLRGNVGVGTQTPGYKLDVSGSVNATGLCIFGVCKTDWSQVGGGGGSSQWTTNGSNVYYNTGDVGIGITTPTEARLHLYSAGNTYLRIGAPLASQSAVAFSDDTNGQDVVLFRPNGTRDFSLWTATAGQVLNVTQAGNVGVGTIAPSAPLEVSKSQASTTTIQVTNGNASAGNAAAVRMFTSGNNALTLSATGNAGAGGYAAINQEANLPLLLMTNNTEQMRITDGNVNVTGNITATGNIAAKYQDVAEWVRSSQKLSAGTVVILDAERTNEVLACAKSYDTKVAGVISAQPGITLGERGEGKVLVATTGRVKVRVDATRAPIKVGDLLVTSDVEGVAMKSVPVELGGVQLHRPGTLIGKALEPLEKGVGEILVLLSLQ